MQMLVMVASLPGEEQRLPRLPQNLQEHGEFTRIKNVKTSARNCTNQPRLFPVLQLASGLVLHPSRQDSRFCCKQCRSITMATPLTLQRLCSLLRMTPKHRPRGPYELQKYTKEKW
eukprot:887008-Pelagomonas_calceolata.AAC.2